MDRHVVLNYVAINQSINQFFIENRQCGLCAFFTIHHNGTAHMKVSKCLTIRKVA